MIEELKGTPWKPVPGRDSLKIPTNIHEDGTILDESGKEDGYVEENANLEERFNPGIDVEQDEQFERIFKAQEERRKSKEAKIAKESKTIPMGFTNVRITKDLVVKYGPTKGCLGCKRALGEISYYQGHTDHCRKRFLELSNEPGNEEFKSRLDQSFERTTRKHLEREEPEEAKREESKDSRHQKSKQT